MADFAPDQVDFYLSDPDAAFRRLRAEDPLHWYEPGRFWCALRHAEVCEISRRPRTFSSAHGTQLFEVPLRLEGRFQAVENMPASIIQMDPPEHNRHRKLVMTGSRRARSRRSSRACGRWRARPSPRSAPASRSTSWSAWRFRCRCW